MNVTGCPVGSSKLDRCEHCQLAPSELISALAAAGTAQLSYFDSTSQRPSPTDNPRYHLYVSSVERGLYSKILASCENVKSRHEAERGDPKLVDNMYVLTFYLTLEILSTGLGK